jgi:hypothetical protein
LTEEIIPPPGSDWYPDLLAFALTFDGYSAYGEDLGDMFHRNWRGFIENGELPESLTELRATLFFLQRFIRWNEDSRPGGPSDQEMRFAHAMVEAIRKHVASAAVDRSEGRSGSPRPGPQDTG